MIPHSFQPLLIFYCSALRFHSLIVFLYPLFCLFSFPLRVPSILTLHKPLHSPSCIFIFLLLPYLNIYFFPVSFFPHPFLSILTLHKLLRAPSYILTIIYFSIALPRPPIASLSPSISPRGVPLLL